MYHIRGLVWLALLLVLAMPALAAAQGSEALPRALRPDGRLPLEGTVWRLRTYVHRGSVRAAGPEVAAWMQLRGGRLAGAGGCSRIRGSYAAMGAALKVNLGTTGKARCAEQAAMVQSAMVAGLDAASSFSLTSGDADAGTELVIVDASDAEVLRFGRDDAASLAAAEWRLSRYGDADRSVPADPTRPAVMSFQPERSSDRRRRSDGRIVGSTGCNGIIGAYVRRADVISFSTLERTDAPCPAAVAEQERVLVTVLEASASLIELPPDRLIMTSADSGAWLELISAVPLEDTTWLLSSLGKDGAPVSTTTLRLRGGQASGEGPCGAYGGRYSSDGLFTSFIGVTGAGAGDCGERGRERDLLKALRRTVLVDRAEAALRLLDAAGKELARFESPASP